MEIEGLISIAEERHSQKRVPPSGLSPGFPAGNLIFRWGESILKTAAKVRQPLETAFIVWRLRHVLTV